MKNKKETTPKEEPKKDVVTSVDQQISKATYNKSGVTVEFTEAKVVEGKAKLKSHVINDPTPPHPDLIQALTILLPHFIAMSPLSRFMPEIDEKYIKARKILDEPETSNIFCFEVNGCTFSGDSEGADYTVQLIGRLKYPNGKVISMTLPGERLNADGGYANKEQFTEDLNSYIDEIDQFVFKGKALQLTLNIPEPANGNDER